MNITEAVQICMRKYADFKGRAGRPEFWWFVLAYVIGAIVLSLLGVYVLSLLYGLALFLPLSAAGARRLQDTGRNGLLIFIPTGISLIMQYLVPRPQAFDPDDLAAAAEIAAQTNWGLLGLLTIVQLILTVLFLWWLSRPGDPGANDYGPPPAA
ncbi:MAG: DUF805 domain-containing protein [Rhodobacter sp.]|nr:DUF805 domain-containing protein [Rhodobacter sp.]